MGVYELQGSAVWVIATTPTLVGCSGSHWRENRMDEACPPCFELLHVTCFTYIFVLVILILTT